MAQPPPYPDAADTDAASERDERTPRWKTVLGILIALIVIGLIAYLHLAGIVGPGAHSRERIMTFDPRELGQLHRHDDRQAVCSAAL